MIYVDLTGLCDRKWTGVEKYADTLFFMLKNRFGKENVIGLKVGSENNEEDCIILGKNYGRILTEYFYLPRFIKKHTESVFIFPVFPPAKLCWKYSKKILPVIHDVVPWKFTNTMSVTARHLIVPRMKYALRFAKKIITVSETAKKELQALRKDAKIVVIYNAFESEKPSKTIFDRLGITEKRYFLSVSTLEPRKNFPYLLKVADSIFDYSSDYKLVIVGRIGWGKFSYIPKNKNQFVFTGYVSDEDLHELYRGAKLFITLPIDEGFGRTPVEAALCGTPVAVSDIPIFHEVLGENALYLPLNDVESCVALLKKTLLSQNIEIPNKQIFYRFNVDVVSRQIPDNLCDL